MLFDAAFLVCIVCMPLIVGGLGVLAWRQQRRAPALPTWTPPSIEQARQVGASARVAAALAAGDKIGAIKAYREERTGVGLGEAKHAVEAVLFRLQARAFLASPTSEQVVNLMGQGRTNEAIQVYQTQAGVSPYEARMIVDTLHAEV